MKAILVIDEMPKTCGDCPFSRSDEDDFESTWVRCYAYNSTTLMDESADMFKKPSWCPLKPLPTKITTATLSEQDQEETELLTSMALLKTYADGWNDCLKEIKGD